MTERLTPMDCDIIRNKVQGLVDSFAEHASSEIASMFQQWGITGDTATADTCVVSTYLHHKFPEVKASTCHIDISLFTPDQQWIGGVRVPHTLSAFIRDFDLGHYPELIAKPNGG